MSKKHLDELREYQEKQYLPHTHHIQGGELPFTARQMMKQGAKKGFYLLLPLASFALALIVMLHNWFSLPKPILGALVALWAVAIVVAAILILRVNARRRAEAAAAKNKQRKKKKKR